MIYNAIVIGAGPCGLVVSAALHGLTPYLGTQRLFDQKIDTLCQETISHIQERRSENPISLTYEHLDETKQISFRHEPERAVSHIVLTSGQIGGCWNEMDSELKCLSPARWMQLPGLAWQDVDPNARPSMGEVRGYYQEYARRMQLLDVIQTQTTVTSAKRIDKVWHVHATKEGQEVVYYSKTVVLANGNYTIPKMLEIPGEDLDFVHHRMPTHFQNRILVVGSGIGAADTILKALRVGSTVFHLFKSDTTHGIKKLENQYQSYSDYAILNDAMNERLALKGYTPFKDSKLASIGSDRSCLLTDGTKLDVDEVIILIGTKSNLGFLNGTTIEQTNKLSYEVQEGLYAVGPLTGDNFVKFNVGGCFAAANQVIKDSIYVAF